MRPRIPLRRHRPHCPDPVRPDVITPGHYRHHRRYPARRFSPFVGQHPIQEEAERAAPIRGIRLLALREPPRRGTARFVGPKRETHLLPPRRVQSGRQGFPHRGWVSISRPNRETLPPVIRWQRVIPQDRRGFAGWVWRSRPQTAATAARPPMSIRLVTRQFIEVRGWTWRGQRQTGEVRAVVQFTSRLVRREELPRRGWIYLRHPLRDTFARPKPIRLAHPGREPARGWVGGWAGHWAPQQTGVEQVCFSGSIIETTLYGGSIAETTDYGGNIIEVTLYGGRFIEC